MQASPPRAHLHAVPAFPNFPAPGDALDPSDEVSPPTPADPPARGRFIADRTLWLGLVVVLLFQLPAFLLWDDVRIRIEDNLESFVAFHGWRGMHPEYQFVDIPVMLGGLPWAAYSHEPSVITLVYLALPPLAAYYTNELLMRLIAFLSLYLLLNRITPKPRAIHAMVALSYAALPYWMNSGASIAGMPAVMWAALTLLEDEPGRRRMYGAYAIMGLYPVYSLLAYSGLFVLMVGGVWFLLAAGKRRPGARRLFLGLALMTAVYMAENAGLLLNTIAGGPWVWQRSEFTASRRLDQVIQEAVYLFFRSHYHAEAAPYPWLWLVVLFGLGLAAARGLRRGSRDAGAAEQASADGAPENPGEAAARAQAQPRSRADGTTLPDAAWIVRILFAILLISAFFVLFYEDELFQLRRRFALLKELRMDRFYFLFPLLWHLAADFAAVRIWSDRSPVRIVAPLLLAAQFGYLVTQAEWFDREGSRRDEAPFGFQEAYPLAGHARYLDPGARPTYRQFVARDLFDAAERLIGRPRTDLDVACLGIYPSQANLNDFRTVEGYWYLYPLQRKHLWREVVRGELERSPELRRWFNGWGSMAYLFSSELGANFLIEKRRKIDSIGELRIDTQALAALGTDYIFSAVRIGNAGAIGLRFLGGLQHEDAAMDLYVYEVPPYVETEEGPGAADGASPQTPPAGSMPTTDDGTTTPTARRGVDA